MLSLICVIFAVVMFAGAAYFRANQPVFNLLLAGGLFILTVGEHLASKL